jgi:4-amino-4-deoxy-L-arabinose transferase-like glycosyltransferase
MMPQMRSVTFPLPELFFTLAALAAWALLRGDFGMSWDVSVDYRFGTAVRQVLFEGQPFDQLAKAGPENMKYYSPVVPLLASLAAWFFGGSIVSSGAAVTGLFWVATFWPICALGRRLAGEAGAWLSGCALVGWPAYFGHAFINIKDMPLAAATAWLVWAAVCAEGRLLTVANVARCGLAFGAVLAARPGAWFLGLLLVAPALRGLVAGSDGRRRLMAAFTFAAACLAVAWVVMIIAWPHAHRSPIGHPWEAMALAARFQESYLVMFAGEYRESSALPWFYLPAMFGLTTPIPILLAFGAFHLWLFQRLRFARPEWVLLSVLLFVVWFPLACFVVLRMNVYDGIRHFLFVVPMAAVCAGTGAAWTAAAAFPHDFRRAAACGVAALALLAALPSQVTLHPYQYAYYNALAGSRETLHERFETDYWATSYREAAEWLDRSHPGPAKVLVAANDFSVPAFVYFANERFRVIYGLAGEITPSLPEGVDYAVAFPRFRQDANFPSEPIIHSIQRDGVRMAIIRQRSSRGTNGP